MKSTQAQWVQIEVANQSMPGYLASPQEEGVYPAVIVLMEIFGINAHIQEVTERIAAEGYHALAINYYHRTAPELCLGYREEDVTEGRRHKDQTTLENLRADLQGAIGYLQGLPGVSPTDRMGCVGFCFGGHVAYIAATLPEVQATAVFYGAGIPAFCPGVPGQATLALTPQMSGRVLCLFGDQDPLIPLTDTVAVEKALQQYGVAHEVVRYPEAGHGFFCNQRQDYEPHAAQDAWNRLQSLFQQSFSP
jgi:carboxymethylenebutenolidase